MPHSGSESTYPTVQFSGTTSVSPLVQTRIRQNVVLLGSREGVWLYRIELFGEWRSLVAHLLWEQGVLGSNPGSPTIYLN